MECPIKPGYLVQWNKKSWWCVTKTENVQGVTELYDAKNTRWLWNSAVDSMWKYIPNTSLGKKLYDISG